MRRFMAQPPLERRVMRLEVGKMKLKNCPACGKPVRLGATKIRVDRKPGVAHYIAHMDGSPMHDKGWDCAALKPYPAREEDKPWAQLCARWNDA